MHFCSVSLSVHSMLWTPQKTDISCNPFRLLSRASPQPLSPHCQGAHPPTEADHGPGYTVSPRPHAIERKQAARDVCSSANQCFGVSKGKEPAELYRDYPRLASDKQQSQRWRIHPWWGKSRVREKESLGSQKIRCDAQQRSAVQPYEIHTHTHKHTQQRWS